MSSSPLSSSSSSSSAWLPYIANRLPPAVLPCPALPCLLFFFFFFFFFFLVPFGLGSLCERAWCKCSNAYTYSIVIVCIGCIASGCAALIGAILLRRHTCIGRVGSHSRCFHEEGMGGAGQRLKYRSYFHREREREKVSPPLDSLPFSFHETHSCSNCSSAWHANQSHPFRLPLVPFPPLSLSSPLFLLFLYFILIHHFVGVQQLN